MSQYESFELTIFFLVDRFWKIWENPFSIKIGFPELNKIDDFRQRWYNLMHENGVFVDPRTLMVSAGIPDHCFVLAQYYNNIAQEISDYGLTDERYAIIIAASEELIAAIHQ